MSNGSRYSKKTFSYRKPKKKKVQEMRKKHWKDLERQENVRIKTKATLVIKKQSKRCSSEVVRYLQEKLEQDRELR